MTPEQIIRDCIHNASDNNSDFEKELEKMSATDLVWDIIEKTGELSDVPLDDAVAAARRVLGRD